MWVLEDNDADPDRVIYLRCEVELTVSRKEGINIILLTNDGSISRKHATIKITHNVANVGNPQILPEVYLTDEGSKYGNFINENIEDQMKIEPNNPIRLDNNTRIRFGMMHNVWRLVYHPMVVTNSTLDKASKSSLNQALLTLGGHVVGDWTQDCSLLVMNNITLTVKVVCALASRRLIVTPEYFTVLIEAIRNNESHPNPNHYEPPLQEMSIKRSEASFSPNEMRKEVFSGQTFLFTSPKQFKRMTAAVKLAGGQSILLEEENSNLVSVKGHLLVQLPPEKDLQLNPPVYFTKSKKYLAKKELRCIPESEIGLAVLYCSTEKNCNPAFKTNNIFKRSNSSMSESQSNLKIYATETQNTEYSISLTAMPGTRVIPESGQSKTTPSPKNTETAFKTPEPVVLNKTQGSATANISSPLKESSNKKKQDEVANKKRGRSGSNDLSSPQSKRRNSVIADPNPTQPMEQTQPMDSQEEINDSEIHPETFLAGVKAHSTQKTNRKEDIKKKNPTNLAMRQSNSDESDITNITGSLSSPNNNNMPTTTGVTTESSASFPKVLTYEPFTLPTLRTGATVPITEDGLEDSVITEPFPSVKQEPQSLDIVDGIDDEGWRHGKRKRGSVLETTSTKSNKENNENDSSHNQSVASKHNQNRIKRERSLSGDKEAADRLRDIKREKQDEDLFNISKTTSRRNRGNPRPVSPAACGTEFVQPTPQDNLFNLPTSSRARRKQESSMNNVTESSSKIQGAVPGIKKEVENVPCSSTPQNISSHVAPSGEFIKKKTSPFKRSPSELERTVANNDQQSSIITENENGMNETLEKSLAVVVFVDLIRRLNINENNKTVNNSSLNNTMVRNFKRFKKNSRNNIALPRVIGGTDLKPHDALNDTRKDDWFNDHLEVTQRLEREEEDKRQAALGHGWDSGNSNSSAGKNTNSNENTANELFSMALTSRRRGRK